MSSSSAFARAASSVSSFASSSFRAASSVARCFSAVARRAPSRARSSEAIAASTRATSSASFAARSAAVACSASGRSRFLHLVLEVAGALDLDRDPRELELGPVPAQLEAAEPGSLLDERAPLGGLRAEHRLDAALRDHRAQAAAEADVGEQLDQVEAAHRRAVHEVLPLAAAVQPARERHLGERQVGPGAVLVVEDQLDLAEVGGLAARGPGEEDVVGLLGAQLVRAQRPGRPEDRVGDVRLPGAVRPDDDRDARLEAHLDRVHERLEPAELDRLQVHARRSLPSAADTARYSGAGSGSSPSSASRAASCSASFFEPPVPTPACSPSISAAAVNLRSWAGPSEASSV